MLPYRAIFVVSMKRAFATILLLCYLAVSAVASMQAHYCMGKLIKLSLTQAGENHCSNCGMDKKMALGKKCCQESEHKVSTDQAQAAKGFTFNFQSLVATLVKADHFEALDRFSTELVLRYHIAANASNQKTTALHVLNCSYRI